MCGITGYKKHSKPKVNLTKSLTSAVDALKRRGPDHSATYVNKFVGLGHTRLSIIDTSSLANQPMTDSSGRYTLVFNGEIYNYNELKKSLSFSDFKSTSDTEVLLYLLIEKGIGSLQLLNGFFAFALYDAKEESLLLARDRMGIKPLHYYNSGEFFAFGSEMKALLEFPIPRKIERESLYWYLRLTYLPHDRSMIEGVKKLLPGHYLILKDGNLKMDTFWSLEGQQLTSASYSSAKHQITQLLEQSVERRMVADVPLGAFLSGGTDSSAVVSMASGFDANLNTFSIGYRHHSFFDETKYAELVAKKFKTNHTTFSLTNDDLLNSLNDVLNYIDEPFGDSSAIPTFILSQQVSQSMKVSLSGDGADELFGGYYKHLAFKKSINPTFTNYLLKNLNHPFSFLPHSRSSSIGNLARRLSKYSELLKLNTNERYWRLASFNNNAKEFINDSSVIDESVLKEAISGKEIASLNDFLDCDLKMVLPGDMLTKVDLMSMANGLEVRVPFLDMELITYVRSLPDNFKVRGNHRKRVLQDAFEHILPKELHHRPKKGFEVPLLSWMRNELGEELNSTVFNMDRIEEQNIFNSSMIMELKKQLNSNNPGDVHSNIWSVYIFQKWYDRYFTL